MPLDVLPYETTGPSALVVAVAFGPLACDNMIFCSQSCDVQCIPNHITKNMVTKDSDLSRKDIERQEAQPRHMVARRLSLGIAVYIHIDIY